MFLFWDQQPAVEFLNGIAAVRSVRCIGTEISAFRPAPSHQLQYQQIMSVGYSLTPRLIYGNKS
jgi:hypothetical protein